LHRVRGLLELDTPLHFFGRLTKFVPAFRALVVIRGQLDLGFAVLATKDLHSAMLRCGRREVPVKRAPICVLLAACGSSGMQAPPPYDPANSPEAPTTCLAETRSAKAAREAVLGADSASVQLGESAAGAVYALAECERKQFDGYDLDTPDD